jgi:hypothetical protein
MKVRVYFNLHKKMLSVQEKINGSWKVVDHVEQIWLGNAKFKVSEVGRQRVIKNKRKNVHAYIEGTANAVPENLTPFDSINYCAKRSVDSDGAPNFLFFENMNGYNFCSLSTLVKQKPNFNQD